MYVFSYNIWEPLIRCRSHIYLDRNVDVLYAILGSIFFLILCNTVVLSFKFTISNKYIY